MNLKVKMKLNSKTEIEVDFEGSDLQDVIRQAGVFLDFNGKCSMCDSEEVSLQTRITKDKGYKYTEFTCRSCGAKRTFGKYQDGGGFFLKDWEQRFNGSENAQQ